MPGAKGESAATPRPARFARPIATVRPISARCGWSDRAMSIEWWRTPSFQPLIRLSIVGYEFRDHYRHPDLDVNVGAKFGHGFFCIPSLRQIDHRAEGAFPYVRLSSVSSYQRSTHTSGCFYASVSRGFLVESGSCDPPYMSADGCLHGSFRWPAWGTIALSLYPLHKFALHKAPHFPLSFAHWVRWNVAASRPVD